MSGIMRGTMTPADAAGAQVKAEGVEYKLLDFLDGSITMADIATSVVAMRSKASAPDALGGGASSGPRTKAKKQEDERFLWGSIKPVRCQTSAWQDGDALQGMVRHDVEVTPAHAALAMGTFVRYAMHWLQSGKGSADRETAVVHFACVAAAIQLQTRYPWMFEEGRAMVPSLMNVLMAFESPLDS